MGVAAESSLVGVALSSAVGDSPGGLVMAGDSSLVDVVVTFSSIDTSLDSFKSGLPESPSEIP